MNLRSKLRRGFRVATFCAVAFLFAAAVRADEVDVIVTRSTRWKNVVPFENWRELPNFLALAWDTQAFECWIKTQPMTPELKKERFERRERLREMLREIRKKDPYVSLDHI